MQTGILYPLIGAHEVGFEEGRQARSKFQDDAGRLLQQPGTGSDSGHPTGCEQSSYSLAPAEQGQEGAKTEQRGSGGQADPADGSIGSFRGPTTLHQLPFQDDAAVYHGKGGQAANQDKGVAGAGHVGQLAVQGTRAGKATPEQAESKPGEAEKRPADRTTDVGLGRQVIFLVEGARHAGGEQDFLHGSASLTGAEGMGHGMAQVGAQGEGRLHGAEEEAIEPGTSRFADTGEPGQQTPKQERGRKEGGPGYDRHTVETEQGVFFGLHHGGDSIIVDATRELIEEGEEGPGWRQAGRRTGMMKSGHSFGGSKENREERPGGVGGNNGRRERREVQWGLATTKSAGKVREQARA
jgi:hypothetical protein